MRRPSHLDSHPAQPPQPQQPPQPHSRTRRIDITPLLLLAELSAAELAGIRELVCATIVAITHHRAVLQLQALASPTFRHQGNTWISLPVVFEKYCYGHLLARPVARRQRPLSLLDGLELAETCGKVLARIEQTAHAEFVRCHSLLECTDPLTLSERRVLLLMYEGRQTAEIAIQLQRSPGTVKSHKRKIYNKLDASSVEQALSHGRQDGQFLFI